MRKCLFILWLIPTLIFADSWNKEITNRVMENRKLEMTEELTIYTGDKVQNDIIHEAPLGMKYLLVPFKVMKNGVEQDMFDSKKLFLVAGGEKFARVSDDSFLDKFNIKKFTKLRVKLGTQEGMIVYEVSENLNLDSAYLEYEGEKIELKR